MNIEELKQKMMEAEEKYGTDYEGLHLTQDYLLLEYINNKEIEEIFDRTSKWYA